MSVFRTREGWNKKGRIIKPYSKRKATLASGESLFSKDQTCFKWELPVPEQTPDSWYLGDGEDYN